MRVRLALLLLLAAGAFACGDEAGDSDPLGGTPGSSGQNGGGSIGGTVGGGGPAGASTGGTVGGALPPEEEIDVPFEAPQAGRTTVYVPNPGTNRVAAVNASSFEIEILASGLAPTYAATVPGQDVAIVLNVASSDASILRTKDGKTTLERLPIGHDQNAIAISPDGQHALVYFDARLSKKLAQSFQDVTVINLKEGEEAVRGVSVGFRPRAVSFSTDSQRAYVVTEDGISVIDLAASDAGPTIAALVSVGDKVGEPVSDDVQVNASGAFAVARRAGDPKLRLINLDTEEITTLSLETLQAAPPPDAGTTDGGMDGGADAGADSDAGTDDAGDADADAGDYELPYGPLELTDLDLAPDGSYALAVVRNAGALLRIPIPEGFSDPSKIQMRHIEDALIGSVSVSKQGNIAALYTTAVPAEALVLVDLAADLAPRAVRLRKAVRAVALSDDGSRALVLHQAVGTLNAAADEEARIDASQGYSLIEVPRAIAKLQLTPTAVREGDLFVTPDSSHLFMLLRDDGAGVRRVDVADLRSFQVTTQELAKPPSSLGIVPDAARLFVGQESEGGMITFLDAETGEVVHAVSGFELSGRVRQ